MGKNTVGKSSIVDAFCYGIFNKINKEGANKNEEYINSRKKKCKVELEIDFGGIKHFIKRSTARPQSEYQPAVTEIDFYKKEKGKKISLNGGKKPETNKNIRNKFGTLEDFVITSLCPQEGLTSFLDMKKTDRKKKFGKFLDQDIFDQKFKLADADADQIKNKLKIYEDINFSFLSESLEEEIKETKSKIEKATSKKLELEEELQTINNRIIDQSSKIKEIGDDTLSIEELEKLVDNTNKEIEGTKCLIEAVAEEISEFKPICVDTYTRRLDEIRKQLSGIKEIENNLNRIKKESLLLEQVPCGDGFPVCPFIIKAHEAKEELRGFDGSKLKTKDELQEEEQEVKKALFQIQKMKEKASELENLKLKLENLELKQDTFKRRKRNLDEFKDVLKANKELSERVKKLKKEKEEILISLGETNKEIIDSSKLQGAKEVEYIKVIEDATACEKLRREYHCYQLYLKAMGKNGISYFIMSQKLPAINQETNKILSQVTNFNILIEDSQEEKSIKLYIIGGGKGKRSVELGSGFEKTIISLALRAALWNISSLPKTPCLFLDEPFGHIEEGKFSATMDMLRYLNKNFFKHIFIISHDSNLKSIVDNSIYISSGADGFAYCEV